MDESPGCFEAEALNLLTGITQRLPGTVISPHPSGRKDSIIPLTSPENPHAGSKLHNETWQFPWIPSKPLQGQEQR